MKEITVYYRKMGKERSDVLLRLAASRFTGIPPGEFEILREPGKKPLFIRPPDLFASVSHSGGVWAAAFSREFPVGLDVQKSVAPLRRDKIALRYFHPEEDRAVLSDPDPDAAFCRIWCRKEAVSKLPGRGIDAEFSSFDTTRAGDGITPVSAYGSDLFAADFSLPGFPDLLASAAAPCPLRVLPVLFT